MGGLLRCFKTIGDTVVDGEILGVVADPFGENEVEILSPDDGVVIGRRNMPIVNEGDAVRVGQLRRQLLGPNFVLVLQPAEVRPQLGERRLHLVPQPRHALHGDVADLPLLVAQLAVAVPAIWQETQSLQHLPTARRHPCLTG